VMMLAESKRERSSGKGRRVFLILGFGCFSSLSFVCVMLLLFAHSGSRNGSRAREVNSKTEIPNQFTLPTFRYLLLYIFFFPLLFFQFTLLPLLYFDFDLI
jgi:hypothetical protein